MKIELPERKLDGIAHWHHGPGGLPQLEIRSPLAMANLFLYGGQLTHWQPANETQPVLWMSAHSQYEYGKPIRGGVPVCLPWFGPRDGLPAHGFLRNRAWVLHDLVALPSGEVRVSLVTSSDATTRKLWPHDFIARLTYTVGTRLKMAIEMENTSSASFVFSEALHTYLAVSDIRRITVHGLDGALYRDFKDRSILVRQAGFIDFTAETDRVYVDTEAATFAEDPVWRRRIYITKRGSGSTVIWNPWISKASAMTDFGDEEWLHMLCIETANAAENSITLPAGANHAMTTEIHVEPIS